MSVEHSRELVGWGWGEFCLHLVREGHVDRELKAGTREEGVPIMRAREGSRAFLGYRGWESLMTRKSLACTVWE